MGIYTNFVCELALRQPDGTPGECKSLAPLNFDLYEETWGSMVEFARSEGWTIVGGPKQSEMKCWCPAHSKVEP